MEMMPEKEKPQIRQAGSAEAFVGSAATGRERSHYWHFTIKDNAFLALTDLLGKQAMAGAHPTVNTGTDRQTRSGTRLDVGR